MQVRKATGKMASGWATTCFVPGTGLGCARACTHMCVPLLPSDIVNPGLDRGRTGGKGPLSAERNSTGKGRGVETKPGVRL